MTKFYNKKASAAEIVSDLEQIFAQDKVVERKMKLYVGGIISTIIGIFIFIFLSAAIEAVAAVLLVASIAFLIFCIVQYVRYSNRNIEDRKILTGLKMARIIGVDLRKNSPLEISISFEDYLNHGKALVGNKKGGKFLDTWFQVRGRLADDTLFDIGVDQKVSRKERSKRKYTKVKEAVQEIVSLELRPAASTFSRLDNFPQALNDQRTSAQNAGQPVLPFQIRRAEVRNGTVRINAVTPHYVKVTGRSTSELNKDCLIDGDRILVLMLEAYAAMQRCK